MLCSIRNLDIGYKIHPTSILYQRMKRVEKWAATKNKTLENTVFSRVFLVEPRGVEPLSEDQKTRASPSAVYVLTFPLPGSHRQDSGFSSFIKSRFPQSFEKLVPCYYDADGLRRRRLRVDDRRLSCDCYVFVVVSSF